MPTKIQSSDLAPAETVHYDLAGVEFDLSGKKSFETDDVIVISNARSHPWLKVIDPEIEQVVGALVEQIKPEDDPFSLVNYHGNDPERIKADEAAKAEAAGHPVAIEAGTPQTELVVTGGVAETLAADDTSKTSDKVSK